MKLSIDPSENEALCHYTGSLPGPFQSCIPLTQELLYSPFSG